MNYKKFADTELEISEITLGTWVFGHTKMWNDADDKQSVAVIKKAIDKGINSIATSAGYGTRKKL